MWSSSILATLSPLGDPHNTRLVNPKHYPIDMSRELLQAQARWNRSTEHWKIPETNTRVPMEKMRVWHDPPGVRVGI
jgi:hypothetical protein